MTKNLWILTEERPKRDVIYNILFKFSKDNEIPSFRTIRLLRDIILPDYWYIYEDELVV